MKSLKKRITATILVVALLTVCLGGCGKKAKTTITIGSKPITESYIMGEMAALLLEDAGFDVDREYGLGSSSLAHEALRNHDIDLYLEYNGTALVAFFGKDAITDSEECNKVVKDEYEKIGITPLEPIGFNNTYCITVTSEFSEANNVKTISDLAKIADTLTIGSAQEFIPREDGLHGLEETYGFTFGKTIGLDPGLMYEALGKGDVDCCSGFATDGQIGANNYVNLEDDKQFFPPYDAMYVVDSDVLSENPDIEKVLNKLAGQIDDKTMSELNYRVDNGGEEYDEVAKDFLKSNGYIE